MNSDLIERLDRVESHQAIARLAANYCHGVDLHDENLFLSIWHDDALWSIGGPWGDFKGTEEIQLALRELIWAGLPETHHWTTNLVVDLQGDQASGICNVNCAATDMDGRAIRIAATYRDRYERSGGEWRIGERAIELFYFLPVDRPWGTTMETRFDPPPIQLQR